jgi:hypothetical protein
MSQTDFKKVFLLGADFGLSLALCHQHAFVATSAQREALQKIRDQFHGLRDNIASGVLDDPDIISQVIVELSTAIDAIFVNN